METTTTAQITLTRHFKASPERVFAAFTDPAALSSWFAPTYEYYPAVDAVVMPGGSFRSAMQHQGGNVHVVVGTFKEVSPPHRIVFTWQWEGGDMAAMGESLVSVDITPSEDGCTLTLTHEGFPNAEAGAEHKKGWDGCLIRLADMVASEPDAKMHWATVLAFHSRLYFNVLAGVTPNHLRQRLNDRTNHMLWMAGHLANSRGMIAQMLGQEIESPMAIFNDPISDEADYPDWEAIEAFYREASTAIMMGLRALPAEALAAPHVFPHPIPINDQSLGGMLDFLVDHESYHLGQLGFLRKYLGYDAMDYSPSFEPTPRHVGRFTWFDLMTTDVPAAVSFYSKVIGWGTEHWAMGDGESSKPPYTMWANQGKPVGGVMPMPPEVPDDVPPHFLAYIGTADVDSAAEQVAANGGAVLNPPMDIPSVGRFSVVADPQGAMFSLFAPAEEAPGHDGPAQVGEMSWRELITTDAEAAQGFYGNLFAWQKAGGMDMSDMGLGWYHMFGRAGTMLGGMFDKSEDMPAPPSWLLYFRVPDVAAAVDAVNEGGGSVMSGPMEVPGGDIIAVCVDPQGAAFGLHAVTS